MKKLTYGELPIRDTCIKLSMVSFGSPSKNLRVYKFCEALKVLQNFLMNEQNKLLEKYGKEVEPGKFNLTADADKKYREKMIALQNLEIESGEIPELGLVEDDFMDENCQYPADKRLWLNASEISTILAFLEKLKVGV